MSSANPACCASGHLHSGQPKGRWEQMYDIETYVAGSSSTTLDSQHVVIIFGDIFGAKSPNTQLVADAWADAGFRTLLPDLMEGGGMSVEHSALIVPHSKELDALEAAPADQQAEVNAKLGPLVSEWVDKYGYEAQRDVVEQFLAGIKADVASDTKVIGVGFCWGGRWVNVLAAEEKIDVNVSVHASQTTDEMIDAIKSVPTIELMGDRDNHVNPKQLERWDKILCSNLGAERGKTKLYHNATHGFALRGDDQDERERKMKEDSIQTGVDFVRSVLSL